VGQFFFALGFASIAMRNSGGTVSVSDGACAFHVPLFFASVMSARPAAVMSPASMRRSTRFRLSADQRLFALRGVNTCL
jgi:hypothetical protein